MAKKKFQWEADSGLRRDEPPPLRHRTARKREADAVDQLVQDLLELPSYERAALPLDDEVLTGLLEIERLLAKGDVRGGMRRQRLYVASRLRLLDVDAVREAMPGSGTISPRERGLQAIERWRKKLLAGDNDVLELLLTEFPSGDRQQLRQRIRQAKKEVAAGKPAKAFKALFADLRELLGV